MKVKRIFEKASAIVIIIYFFLPFFTKGWKEILSLYERLIRLLFIIIEGNVIFVYMACIVAIVLILWIIRCEEDEENDKEEIDEAKKIASPH